MAIYIVSEGHQVMLRLRNLISPRGFFIEMLNDKRYLVIWWKCVVMDCLLHVNETSRELETVPPIFYSHPLRELRKWDHFAAPPLKKPIVFFRSHDNRKGFLPPLWSKVKEERVGRYLQHWLAFFPFSMSRIHFWDAPILFLYLFLFRRLWSREKKNTKSNIRCWENSGFKMR